MASVASLPFTLEMSAADKLIFQCSDLRSCFHFSLYRPAKSLHFAALNSSAISRSRWAELPKATGRSYIEEEEEDDDDVDKRGDESAHLLQNTIKKSQKVIHVQKELLRKIAERRKLVSSIKSNIFDPYNDGETVNDDNADDDNRTTNLSSNEDHSSDNALPETIPDSRDFSEGKENPIVTKSSTNEESSNQLKEQLSFLSSPVSNYPILESEIVEKLEERSLSEVNEEDNPVMDEDIKPPPPLAGPNAMNVILVAAECAPWAKTGGLGDVVGALPRALARRGHRVMVVVPLYSKYSEAWDTGIKRKYVVEGQSIEVNYFHAYIDGVDFVFIESPTFRHMGNNIYGGNRTDILKRMVILCKAAIEVPWYVPCGGVCYGDGNLVFIANDWHTALLPVYLKAYYRDKGLMKYTRSVLVIHNIAFQGRGPVSDFTYVDLPPHYMELFRTYDPVGGEHLNIFAAGIKSADRLVTVSTGYAREIKTLEGGWGLHSLINKHDWKLRGIVNGIDTREWDPLTDVHLASDNYSNYSLETLCSGKLECKRALQKELWLPVRDDVVMIGFIGRLDPQKGVDLIAEVVPFLMSRDVQLVMLGKGRLDYEEMLRRFENEHRDKVRGWVGFSTRMAHRITAGADILLMPSRFEPCGLNQLYAMRYGTVPVVHAVGGLKETVQGFNPFEETGHGWTFDQAAAGGMMGALDNCFLTYREYRESWEGLQRRGMMQDLSWDNAAKDYEEVLVAAKYQW